jgi:hypothetical protein
MVKDNGNLRLRSILTYGHVSINLLSWAGNIATNLYVYSRLSLSNLATPFFNFLCGNYQHGVRKKLYMLFVFYNVVYCVYWKQNTELVYFYVSCQCIKTLFLKMRSVLLPIIYCFFICSCYISILKSWGLYLSLLVLGFFVACTGISNV